MCLPPFPSASVATITSMSTSPVRVSTTPLQEQSHISRRSIGGGRKAQACDQMEVNSSCKLCKTMSSGRTKVSFAGLLRTCVSAERGACSLIIWLHTTDTSREHATISQTESQENAPTNNGVSYARRAVAHVLALHVHDPIHNGHLCLALEWVDENVMLNGGPVESGANANQPALEVAAVVRTLRPGASTKDEASQATPNGAGAGKPEGASARQASQVAGR